MAKYEVRKGQEILSTHTSLLDASGTLCRLFGEWNRTHTIPADWREYHIHEVGGDE